MAVTELRVESSLVTALVDGERVSLSAAPIPPGIWAAVDVGARDLAQTLAHTWDEPLYPADVVRVGSEEHVEALLAAFAEAVEAEPELLLRWRGYRSDAPASEDPWEGGELPALPPPARRPPESVPKRFGASGIRIGDDDLVTILSRAYAALHAPEGSLP